MKKSLFVALLFFFCSPFISFSDTIFMKDGTRLDVNNVKLDSDKYQYEMFGELYSVDKEKVDHIDFGEVPETPKPEVLEEPINEKRYRNTEQKKYSSDNRIGISYYQVIDGLDNHFKMEKSSSVKKQDRYMGKTKLALLEVIGNKDNITQASLIIFIPNDSPNDLIWNTGYLLRFVKNTNPGWEDSSNWVTKSLEYIGSHKETPVSITRGNKKIEMRGNSTMGMIIITVEHE